MYLSVTRLLARQASLFVAGRLAELAHDFSLPCPVQRDDQLRVMRSAADVVDLLAGSRGAMGEVGAPTAVPHVAAIELPRGGRFRVWVRWALQAGPGARLVDVSMIYYLRAREGGLPIIEMLDCSEVAVVPHAPRRTATSVAR